MLFITTLPKDYARCFNQRCENKIKCLRYLDRFNGNIRSDFNNNNCQQIIKPNATNKSSLKDIR